MRRDGFPLDHPYLEQCWGPILGPSSVAFLRLMPRLWNIAEPARVTVGELASGLGLGARPGLARTLERLGQFGFAQQLTDVDFGVHTEIPVLPRRYLERLPGWVVQAHHQMTAERRRAVDAMASPAPGVAELRSRLDGHQQPGPRDRPATEPGLGR